MDEVAGYITFKTKLDNKSFEVEIEQTREYLLRLQKAYEKALNPKNGLKPNEEAIKKLQLEIEKTTNKLKGLEDKQRALASDSESSGGIGGIIKKMSKWGLAVFGIRSAYMLIRQSASQLAEENDVLAGKLNAIRGALANAIAPVAETLVNLVYRLLSYLNVITKTFFKVDLFKKSAKSAKSAVGNAQKLKKVLAGFDEMNILNDTSSSGGGGGAGGGAIEPTPPDTSKFKQWLDKTREQWNELLDINRAEMARMLLEQDKVWGLMKLGWFDTIQGMARIVTGFIDVIKGIWDIILGIFEGDNKKIQEGVLKLIQGIGQILLGLVQTALGIIEMIRGAIWGLIASVGLWIYNKLIKPVINWFKDLWDKIVNGAKTAVEKVKNVFNSIINFFSNAVSKIKETFKTIGTKAGEIVAGAFKAVVNGILKAIESVLNAPIKAINKLTDVINKVPGINIGKLSTFNLPRLAKGGIINMPGKGVPLGIGGEAGREGVIPLTDEQAMAELGENIGRYVVINLTNITKLDSREIARAESRVRNENSFLMNR